MKTFEKIVVVGTVACGVGVVIGGLTGSVIIGMAFGFITAIYSVLDGER